MNQFKILGLVLLANSCFYFTACDDEEPMPMPMGACASIDASYNGDVKAIINASCSVVGCHDGSGMNTFIPEGAEDFTTFDGLSENLNNGNFTLEVITNGTMPPGIAISEEHLEILECWKDSGFPEN